MPRGDLSPDEEVAGNIVSRQLGGTPIARDIPGAAGAVHDLDIELPDGSIYPLEVTSAGDEAIEALRREALSRVWEAPSLNHHWWVTLPTDGTLQVRRLMGEIVPHLEVLERHRLEHVGGVTRRDRRVPDGVDEESEAGVAVQAIFALGVSRAIRVDPPKAGEAARVIASLHGSAGSDFEAMNGLVEACAARKVEKLIAAGGDERHLFVWIRNSASDAELAIATLAPPDSAPALPDGIDVVWVATKGSHLGDSCERLWRLKPPGGWEAIDPRGPSV